jgi:hypothetical protein
MTPRQPFLVAAVCALPLSLVACGSSNSEEMIIPRGTHYSYVVSSAAVPTSDAQVHQFGLDLGTKTSSKLDGTVDNALGAALSGLAAFGFDIQGTITTAVDTGSILLLLDFQTEDFATSTAAGLTVKLGATTTPAPCNGSADTTCRHHLDGMGTFTVAADSPADALLPGTIASGTFKGGPGDITLQIAIGSPTPIKLNLLHARAEASTITETGIMTGNLGGLVTQEQLTGQVGPAIAASVSSILDRDCPVAAGVTRSPPDCSCKNPSTGLLVVHALDGDLVASGGPAANCQITADEVLGFPLVKSLLQPDSCSADSCKAADSLSIGIKITAVKAKIN